MDTGKALHARAETILGKAEYDQAEYLAGLTQAEAEAKALAQTLTLEERLGEAMRTNPLLRHEVEGLVLTNEANRILETEGRENDADRFLEVFVGLAKSAGLYGYGETE